MEQYDKLMVTVLIVIAMVIGFFYTSAEMSDHVTKYHKSKTCGECGKKK